MRVLWHFTFVVSGWSPALYVTPLTLVWSCISFITITVSGGQNDVTVVLFSEVVSFIQKRHLVPGKSAEKATAMTVISTCISSH